MIAVGRRRSRISVVFALVAAAAIVSIVKTSSSRWPRGGVRLLICKRRVDRRAIVRRHQNAPTVTRSRAPKKRARASGGGNGRRRRDEARAAWGGARAPTTSGEHATSSRRRPLVRAKTKNYDLKKWPQRAHRAIRLDKSRWARNETVTIEATSNSRRRRQSPNARTLADHKQHLQK